MTANMKLRASFLYDGKDDYDDDDDISIGWQWNVNFCFDEKVVCDIWLYSSPEF